MIIAAAAASTMVMAGGAIAPVEVVAPVIDDSGFYVGAGYSYIDTDLVFGDFIADDGFNAGTILAGYNFNKYVALEGRYTFSADVDFDGAETYADISSDVWGIYVKPQYPVTENFKVYGLLGYGETEVLDDTGSFQYGLGGSYAATASVEVFGDWVRAYDEDDNDVAFGDYELSQDVFTLGVNYKF